MYQTSRGMNLMVAAALLSSQKQVSVEHTIEWPLRQVFQRRMLLDLYFFFLLKY
jgi:hypothetical protein